MVSFVGKVTFDGQPVPTGKVTFHPVGGGRPSSAKLSEDGSYGPLSTFEKGDGVPPGDYRVTIEAARGVGDSSEGVATTLEWIVPRTYTDPETSGLEVTVDGGPIDFDLSSK